MPTSTFKGPIILTQSQFDSLQAGGLLETGREYLISDAEPEVGLTPTITIEASQVLDTDPALAIQFTADQLAILTNEGYGTFLIDMTASSLGKYCWVKQNKTTTTLVIYRVEDLTVHKITITLATGQGVEDSMTYSFTATWGNIAGTLSNQTDLQTALDAKQATLTAGDNITITNNVISAEVPEMEAPKGGDAFIPVVLNQDGNRYNGLQQIATVSMDGTALSEFDSAFYTYDYKINPIVDGETILYCYALDANNEDAYCKKYYLPSGESAGTESLSNYPSEISSTYRHTYNILGNMYTATILGDLSRYNNNLTNSVILVPGVSSNGNGAQYPRIIKITANNTATIGSTTYTYYETPANMPLVGGWSKFMKLGNQWFAYSHSNDVLIANEDFTEFTLGTATGFTGFIDSYTKDVHQLYTTDGKQIVLATGNVGGKLYVTENGLTFTEKQVLSETTGSSSVVNYVEYLDDQDCFIFAGSRTLYYTKDFTNCYWIRLADSLGKQQLLYSAYNASNSSYVANKKYLGRGLFAIWGCSDSTTKKAYLTTLYIEDDLMFATALTDLGFDASETVMGNPTSAMAAMINNYIYLPAYFSSVPSNLITVSISGLDIKSNTNVSIEAADDNIIVTQPVNPSDPITIGLDSVIVLAESNEGTNYDRSTSISTGYNTSTGTIIDSEITMTGREGTAAEGTTYYTNIRQGQQYVILKEEKPDGEGNQVTDMLYVQGGNTNFSREVKDSNGDRVSYDTYDLQQVCEAALNGGGGSGSSLQADGTTIIDNDGTISTAVGGYIETTPGGTDSEEVYVPSDKDNRGFSWDSTNSNYRQVSSNFDAMVVPYIEPLQRLIDAGNIAINDTIPLTFEIFDSSWNLITTVDVTGTLDYASLEPNQDNEYLRITGITGDMGGSFDDGIIILKAVNDFASYLMTFSSATLGEFTIDETLIEKLNWFMLDTIETQLPEVETIHPIDSRFIDLSEKIDNATISNEGGNLHTVVGGWIETGEGQQYVSVLCPDFQYPAPYNSTLAKYGMVGSWDMIYGSCVDTFNLYMQLKGLTVGDTINQFDISIYDSIGDIITNVSCSGTIDYFSMDTPDEDGSFIRIIDITDYGIIGLTDGVWRVRQVTSNGDTIGQVEFKSDLLGQLVLDPENPEMNVTVERLWIQLFAEGYIGGGTTEIIHPIDSRFIPVDGETLAVDGDNIRVNIDNQTLSTDGGTLHTAIGGGVIPGQNNIWSSDFVEWDGNSSYIRDFGGDSTTIDQLIDMITEAEYQVGDTIPLRFNLMEYGDFFCEGVLDTFTGDQVIIDTITCQDLSLTDGVYTITLDSNNGNVDESFESALIGQFEIDSNPVNAFEVIIEHETPSQTIPIDASFIPVDNETIVVDNGVLKAVSGSSSQAYLHRIQIYGSEWKRSGNNASAGAGSVFIDVETSDDQVQAFNNMPDLITYLSACAKDINVASTVLIPYKSLVNIGGDYGNMCFIEKASGSQTWYNYKITAATLFNANYKSVYLDSSNSPTVTITDTIIS